MGKSTLTQPLLIRHELMQLVVPPAQSHQLVVVALLFDLAVGEDDDVVGVTDGGETVGDHEHGADVHHLLQRVLNEHLGLGQARPGLPPACR